MAVYNNVKVQLVTVAPVDRSHTPRHCDVKKYHVWKWRTFEKADLAQPPPGKKCQCGLLEA